MAYSGGLDSTVLLHATRDLLGGRITALHANHGLHGDAGRWERHCRDTCRALGVDLRSTALEVRTVGQGLEAAAREARFAWFRDCVGPSEVLLLAHHQDDQAETLLLRLLRGSGPDGLGAMAPERPLGGGALLRPFLDLPRRALAAYAQRHGLRWVDDPSNDDERFDRNYLRRRVLPLLEARWPACRTTLARTTGLVREAAAERDALAPPTVRSLTGDPGFACADLPERPAAAALAVRAWLRGTGLRAPGHARLTEFLRQVREGEGASLATSEWMLTRYRDRIFAHSAGGTPGGAERDLAPGQVLEWPGIGRVGLGPAPAAAQGGAAAGEASAGMPGRLVVRTRRGGERLATAAGQHRALKTLLQELGVPPWWRDRLPLLFEQREDGEALVAVGPYAAAPRLADLGLALTWRPEVLARPD